MKNVVPMSYEGPDGDEKLEMVPVINQNSNDYYNVVSDPKSDDEVKENFLTKRSMMKLKQPPRPLSNQSWHKQ